MTWTVRSGRGGNTKARMAVPPSGACTFLGSSLVTFLCDFKSQLLHLGFSEPPPLGLGHLQLEKRCHIVSNAEYRSEVSQNNSGLWVRRGEKGKQAIGPICVS